jgi:predicted alpha/beta-hydrolase family hydrolase
VTSPDAGEKMRDSVEERKVTIPVGEKGHTSGMLSVPLGRPKKTALIVAHGAGNEMTNPLIAAFANGVAAAGYPALRFNFLYMEQGRKAPDSGPTLVATWQAAYRFLKESSGLEVASVVAAGKSMGGRIASQMVAAGQLPVERLVFLGYPLHKTGDPTKLRDTHLYQIDIPMLFIEGTRDTLCDLTALRELLARLTAPHELYTIEGGDHSFHVPKSSGLTEEEIHTRIVETTTQWLAVSP